MELKENIMGNGYHSRSPEELRQYLDGLNQKNKKRPWMQYIIFANIIGVLFVTSILLQDRSLGLNIKPSNKIQVSDFEMYFTKSNETSPDSVSYFLFIKNESKLPSVFPKEDIQVLFTLTTDEQEECIQKKISFDSKNITPKNTDFFSFTIEELEIKKTEGCNTFFHRIKKKGLFDLFAKGNRKFTPEINLIQNNQIFRMRIPN